MLARDVARSGGMSALAVIAAVLVPKCPLCVAAALSAMGLGAAVSSRLAPFVRPFGFALAGLGALVILYFEWRRRRHTVKCACGTRIG